MTRMFVLFAALVWGATLFGEGNISLSFDDSDGLRPKITLEDSIRVYCKHGSVFIEPKSGDDRVEIESDGNLHINDRRVRLSKKQKALTTEYYDLAHASIDKAEVIAQKAVKVGLKGAEIGIKAVAGVFRLLLPGYSAEDLERDMEKEGIKIEEKAQAVEEEAETLVKMIEFLKTMHDRLRHDVPELAQLRWF